MEKSKVLITSLLVLSLALAPFLLYPAFADTVIYSVTVQNSGRNICGEVSGDCSRLHGEEITSSSVLIGQTFHKIDIFMRKIGSPTGTGHLGVWSSTITPTNANALIIIESFNVASLPDNPTEFSFSFGGWTLQADQVVGVYYDVSLNDQNAISIRYSATNQFDGVDTRVTQYRNDVGFLDQTTEDITMVLTSVTGQQLGRCPVGTVLDCVPNTSAWTGFTSGQNATDIAGSITDGLGLTNCGTSGDPETCGSGLFMFAFLLLLLEFLALAGYLGFTTKIQAEKQIADVALVMAIIGFIVLSIGFYLNWIPDIVFYAIVVIIAGFLTFGILSRIRGG